MKRFKFKIDVVVDNKLNYNLDAMEYGIKNIIEVYLYNVGLSSKVSIKGIELNDEENKIILLPNFKKERML